MGPKWDPFSPASKVNPGSSPRVPGRPFANAVRWSFTRKAVIFEASRLDPAKTYQVGLSWWGLRSKRTDPERVLRRRRGDAAHRGDRGRRVARLAEGRAGPGRVRAERATDGLRIGRYAPAHRQRDQPTQCGGGRGVAPRDGRARRGPRAARRDRGPLPAEPARHRALGRGSRGPARRSRNPVPAPGSVLPGLHDGQPLRGPRRVRPRVAPGPEDRPQPLRFPHALPLVRRGLRQGPGRQRHPRRGGGDEEDRRLGVPEVFPGGRPPRSRFVQDDQPAGMVGRCALAPGPG